MPFSFFFSLNNPNCKILKPVFSPKKYFCLKSLMKKKQHQNGFSINCFSVWVCLA